MRLAPGATRRTLLIIGASVAFLASACSTSGGDQAAPTTTVPASTTSTTGTTAATTTSTEVAPTTTEAVPETTTAPPTTAGPNPSSLTAEDVATSFLRTAVSGGDTRPYAPDRAVAEAAVLEWADVADNDRSNFIVEMEPTYVDPDSMAGGPGQCQLVGDITEQCAVLVSPPMSTAGEGSPTLYAVYVTNVDPASDLDDPRYIDYYVIDFEPIAG